jgi:hypothetical protein
MAYTILSSAFGPLYKFTNARGHGGFLHLDNEASVRQNPPPLLASDFL